MKIALTYNLKRSSREEHAEFDTPETIDAIARRLGALGHDVVPVEVTCSIRALESRLARARPELVFNLAEGRRGPFREAFLPAILEELGIPHTGSSASVLALCLDKGLACRVVAAAGVCVPRAAFVRRVTELPHVPLPAIVKPNFEGSSKGITQASVATTERALRTAVARALDRWPDGALVEEYVHGADVSVGWIDGVGLLPPIGFVYEPTGAHAILDYALKQGPSEAVRIEVPARVDSDALRDAAARAFDALGVEGYGRADFRVTPDGRVVFLEMNPLPSLSTNDEELYAAAAAVGLGPRELFEAILAPHVHARAA